MQQQGTAAQTEPAREQPVRVRIGGLTDEIKTTLESIACRAFDIFERKGRAFGSALADWLEAEAEILRPVRLELSESDEAFTLRAEVPGFRPQDLEVSVEPRRVTITGRRESKEERQTKKTIYSERSSNAILRTISLPAEVSVDRATATLKDGVLEVELRKAVPTRKVPVEVKAA